MNRHPLLRLIVVTSLLLFSQLGMAIEANSNTKVLLENKESSSLSAIDHLKNMQTAYAQKNYEILYLSSLQQQLEPMQLIHGNLDEQEVSYFRYLNGVIRESLQYAGKISYFEQGKPAYTLQSHHNRSVFANIAQFDYEQGKQSYDYVILGKGRIAGKQAIAIRMISKDEYRYSYVIWCDLESSLPLRLDTLSQSNIVLEQIMVVSLNVSDEINPWLFKLTQKSLPEMVHIPESTTDNSSKWKVTWLPTGFTVVKDDQHKLMMQENTPVSYILLDDGITNASIYISEKQLILDEKQKLIRRGATVLYTEQRGEVEINVVGDIPLATAKRLVESVVLVNDDN